MLKIEHNSAPDRVDIDVLGRGLDAALPQGIAPVEPFGFFIRDDSGSVVAGAYGYTLFGSIYTDMLWVAPHLRAGGYGTQLMHSVERLGRDKACTFATVTTFSFQALPFYQKLGYHVEFERHGYTKSSTHYFLRKAL